MEIEDKSRFEHQTELLAQQNFELAQKLKKTEEKLEILTNNVVYCALRHYYNLRLFKPNDTNALEAALDIF